MSDNCFVQLRQTAESVVKNNEELRQSRSVLELIRSLTAAAAAAAAENLTDFDNLTEAC